MSNIKCPRCGSTNISHTALGYVERVGTFGLAMGAGFLGSLINHGVGHKAAESVNNNIGSEYECERCGHTFHASKE